MKAAGYIAVSDHAVLRYLERVSGVQVELCRRHLSRRISSVALEGATAVVIDGWRFVIRNGVVVTVLDAALPCAPYWERETS